MLDLETRIFDAQNQSRGCAFSPDGNLFATAGTQGVVSIWDTRDWKITRSFANNAGECFRAVFSPDGRTVFSTGTGWANLWSIDTGECLWKSHPHPHDCRTISQIQFSPDGRTIVGAATEDYDTRSALTIWDAASGRRIVGTELEDYAFACWFEENEPRVATYLASWAGGDDLPRLFSIRRALDLSKILSLDIMERAGGVPIYWPGRKLIALGCNSASDRQEILDITGNVLCAIPWHFHGRCSIALTDIGAVIASNWHFRERHGSICRYDLKTGSEIWRHDNLHSPIHIQISPRGGIFAVCAYEKRYVEFRTLRDGKPVAEPVSRAAGGSFSPDGLSYVTAGATTRVTSLTALYK